MHRHHSDRSSARLRRAFLILAAVLALAACDGGDIDITAPQTPNIPSGSGQASQTLQISGTLTAENGSCLEATILYDGQELAGARAACDGLGGCARLGLRADRIPRTNGHHTIAFQVLSQTPADVAYLVEGKVVVEMEGGMTWPMHLGPKRATLRAGESVTFEIDIDIQ